MLIQSSRSCYNDMRKLLHLIRLFDVVLPSQHHADVQIKTLAENSYLLLDLKR